MTAPPPSAPLGCAVIGLGSIGADHAAILRRLPDARLVIGCDLDPERAAAVGDDAAFTTDADAAITHPEVEAVWVCTPQHLHRASVELALAHGRHVYCEKPMAHDLADANAMIAAAEDADTVLAIGHTLRFHPDFVAAREAVVNGEVGRPAHLSARWNTGDHEGRVISGRTTVPLEMAIHDIDILRWMVGEVVEVYAVPSAIHPCGPGPDAVVGTLVFESGAVAALEHNWLMPAATGMHSDHKLTVFGDVGSVYVDARLTTTQLYGASGTKMVNTAYRQAQAAIPGGALATADRHFIRTVRDGEPWPLTLADARAALEIALAMDESIASGRPVRLGSGRGVA